MKGSTSYRLRRLASIVLFSGIFLGLASFIAGIVFLVLTDWAVGVALLISGVAIFLCFWLSALVITGYLQIVSAAEKFNRRVGDLDFTVDVQTEIRKYKTMMEENLLTEEEFTLKKKQLLGLD